MTNMKKVMLLSALFFVLIVIVFVFFFFLKSTDKVNKPVESSSSFFLSQVELLYSEETDIATKVKALKSLKELSFDEEKSSAFRVLAGETVVKNFFDFGMILSEGFSEKPFTEREIYEYAKYLNTLDDSERNSLLTAYIGLRFYPEEMTRESVSELLHSHQRYMKRINRDSFDCSGMSKFSSVIYLSQKNSWTDVSQEFGDYYQNFDNTFNQCSFFPRRDMIAFMWLAALSDIGNSPKEIEKSQELVTFLTDKKTDTTALKKNLKYSYFVQNPEPDTVSIVQRLISKYPAFKEFIENIQ